MKQVFFKTKTIALSIFCFSMLTLLISCDPDDAPTPPVVTDPISVSDIDGNVYTVVRIGTQLWTVENLRTSRYNDGVSIATGMSNEVWKDATTGAYSMYENESSNNATYGKLYNWYAVNTGKLAPVGWHVPTRAEWEALVAYLGGSTEAGGKMKSTSSLWLAPNLGATNSSGFSALPGGYRSNSGGFEQLAHTAYWWARDERNATQGNYITVDNDLAGAAINGATKQFGYSVRLVKD